MRKPILFCILIMLFCGCIKTNSVVPITAIQEALAGTWQVDSLVTNVNPYTYPITPKTDSLYKDHFVNITNTGDIVHIQMQGSDIMNYTINSGNVLNPYYRSLVGGCGMPLGATTFKVTPHTLQLVVIEGSTILSTTYMHR